MASLPRTPEPSQTLRARIYCRVSSPKQEERGYSLDGQLTECRAMAADLGATVIGENVEVGSGADWDLPVLLELLESANRGEYDLLIVYDTSRLARDIGKLKVVERTLQRAGVTIRFVRQEFDDSPSGQLQRDIMAAVDSFERGNLVVRFTLGKRAKVGRGLVMGQGRVPLGFRRVTDPKSGKTIGLEIDDEQAALVRRIITELQAYSVDQLAERLTNDGIPTPTGGRQWTGGAIFSILNNPAIHGEYVHGKRKETRSFGKRTTSRRDVEDWVSVTVPAIVSVADVEAAKAALAPRKATHGARRANVEADPFTLRGLLRCGHCGGQLTATQQRQRGRLANGEYKIYDRVRRDYTCNRAKLRVAELAGVERCTGLWVTADALEAYAWSMLKATVLDRDRLAAAFEELARQSAADERQADRIAFLTDEIAKRRRRLDNNSRDRMDAEPGSETAISLARTAAQIESELAQLKRNLESVQNARPLGTTADQTAALQEFAQDIAIGIERATPADQRRVFQLLRLTATVTPDVAGEKLARGHFRIVWEGVIDLSAAPVAIDSYNQPTRRNTANDPAADTTMSTIARVKPQDVSSDGVKWKFMP